MVAAVLLGHGKRILLDPEAVVGGHFTYWNPTYDGNSQHLLAKHRPQRVPPPLNASDEERELWDGEEVAGLRKWFVQHMCGKTAVQVVRELRRRRTG
ncbi:hypothetical protein [Nonomuraea sp. NPDC002799]